MRIWLGIIVGIVTFVCEIRGQLQQGDVTIVARPPDTTPCGQYRCLNSAECKDGPQGKECVCPTKQTGDGRFLCYTSNHTRIQIVSNTLASSAHLHASTGVPINWPCSYRLTRIKTRGTGALHACDMQVLGLNKVLNGKIVLYGVQVYLELTTTAKEKIQVGLRKTASARTGIYKYDEWSKNIHSHERLYKRQTSGSDFDGSGSGAGDIVINKRFSPFIDDEDALMPVEPEREPWAQSRSIHVVGEQDPFKFAIDSDSFAVLALKSCGISLKLRPTIDGKSNDEVAGLAVTVDRNNAPISFPDSQTYLNGNVCPFCGQDSRHLVVMPAATQEDVFLSVMKYAAPQDDSTKQAEQCENVVSTYDTFCKNTPDTKVKVCHKLLANKNLIKCMAEYQSSNAILILVSRCLRRVCDNSEMACRLMRTDLMNAKCDSHWSAIRKMLNCPFVN